MGREVRRVPIDFAWPVGKTWTGFILPEHLQGRTCDDCSGGWSVHYEHLQNRWYGNAPFDPSETGSTPLTVTTPEVRAFAERNVTNAGWFYGSDEQAVVREAQRLADLWNGMWMHHLSQDDVDILLASERGLRELTHTWTRESGWIPRDPAPVVTADIVNRWSLSALSFSSSEPYAVITEHLRRQGLPIECGTCDGHHEIELWLGQRAEAEAWKAAEPPTGDGWQLWETVSQGSPISPVFDSAEGLAGWMSSPAYTWGASSPMQYDSALRFVNNGWAPSFVVSAATGITPGEQWAGETK